MASRSYRYRQYNRTSTNVNNINSKRNNTKKLKKVKQVKKVEKVKKINNQKQYKEKKKVKINYKKLTIFLIILLIIILSIISFFRLRITNIYISGNNILSEKEIIDIASVSNYPNTFINLSPFIESRLEKNVYIKDAKVYKKWFTILYIEIEENRPLFYNESSNETVLLDGSTIKEKLIIPTLINMIPDTLYEKFIQKMSEIDVEVLNKVSEIKYDKNEVDETRFLFTMTDGNYVYLTLNTFEEINNYINIVKTFNGAKGILYLDSGEYFQIFEN